MSLLLIFNRKKEDPKNPMVVPVLPKDIYTQGSLDLVDTILPRRRLRLAHASWSSERSLSALLHHFLSALPLRQLVLSVINLDKVLDVSLFIHPIETAQALRGFQKKVA